MKSANTGKGVLAVSFVIFMISVLIFGMSAAKLANYGDMERSVEARLAELNIKDASRNLELTPIDQLEEAAAGEVHASYAPNVPPPVSRTDQRFYEVKLEVVEGVCDIDPANGVKTETWGYRIAGDDNVVCGTPGPVLRGRVGDMVRITVTNLDTSTHPHNIDFHAVTGQGGGAADLSVAPGETGSIDVRLLYPGAFMYHCAYGDVPVHIIHGMYGMFIVDPEVPLPEVDHEWAVMQSEWYLGEAGEDGMAEHDREALVDENPSHVTFNGRTDALAGDNALKMRTGERARIYFVNEGLNLDSNFHPIGSHWALVYPEAATHPSNRTIYGSQTTLVPAGGGTVVELQAEVPSTVILVDHALTRTFYKGAIGLIEVEGPENPEVFEVSKPAGGEADDHDHDDHSDDGSTGTVENVTIKNGAWEYDDDPSNDYSPNTLTVKVGTTVTWTNQDDQQHTVTSGKSTGTSAKPDGRFDSGFMAKGDTFSYTFTKPGTYYYYCLPHPWMRGVVIVEE